jgi:hypothetical protein
MTTGSISKHLGAAAAVVAALVATAAVLSGAGADQKTLERLLPSGKAIRAGWARVPKSLQYGAGNDLTRIYDGGYQMYLDNGVVEAAQVGYQSKAGYTVLTIHTMKSAAACRSFHEYWRKEAADQGKLLPLKLDDAAFVYHPAKTLSYGYLRSSRFLLIADVNLGGDTGVKVLRSFLESVSKAVADLERPTKKGRPGAAP